MDDMINGGGGTEGGTYTQHNATQGGTEAVPISIDEAPLFEEQLPQVTKGTSRWTGNFAKLDDVCLCEAWMEVRQDPICGAQQMGGTFWEKVHNYFQEHKHLGDTPFVSDRSETSLTKRWA
ncbi:uncharacterized protein [Lolium perenne]|uniref:uncharacterized protein n=1 Tax=Lolium perenne TaxID=4522 RepID=UPI003A9A3213